ncbi:MDIS1-interacting receptor like kinase 2-like [Salvia splendens]|uniref:MDIS1-interacting receptor like kinase 2-like n=1 Tax=Salvia splendens TaxID=180675 RepID=UPI001C26DC43|nr:MDIS1-interacting receptor like kinase 2-like [Salvia splendens]
MDVVFAANAIIIFSITILLSNVVVANASNSSREALMDFGWPYINSTAHHCNWKGITCDDHGRVTELSLQTHVGYLSNLSHYLLGSELPPSLVNLSKLNVLDISDNNYIYGVIPPNIGSLSKLLYLNLSHNQLRTTLPLSLPNLTNLEVLHISVNSFFGVIPSGIWGKKEVPSVTPHLKHGDIFKMWNFDGNIAYQDITEATKDFDFKYCIGTGGYGSVYRAQLPTGKVVAIKKLHRFEEDNPVFYSSFRNEAIVLSQIRHRHIVKLFGFCLHKQSMFLIYDYMER